MDHHQVYGQWPPPPSPARTASSLSLNLSSLSMDYPPSTTSSIASPITQQQPQHHQQQFRYTPPGATTISLYPPGTANARSRSASVSVAVGSISTNNPNPSNPHAQAIGIEGKPKPPSLNLNVVANALSSNSNTNSLHSQSAPGSAISISPHPFALSLPLSSVEDGPQQHPTERTVPRKRPSMGDPIMMSPPAYGYTGSSQQQQQAYMDSEMSYSPMDEKPSSGFSSGLPANGYEAGSSSLNSNQNNDGNANNCNSSMNPPTGATSTGKTNPVTATTGSTNFVGKLFQMINDPRSTRFIVWTDHGNSFVVSNITEFSRTILGVHFKHNNFSSFVRQLNMYGFSKVNRTPRAQKQHPESQVWEFAHPKFIRGHPELLEEIRRRPTENGATNHPVHPHSHSHPSSIGNTMDIGGLSVGCIGGSQTQGQGSSMISSIGMVGSIGVGSGVSGVGEAEVTKELTELRKEMGRLYESNNRLETMLDSERRRVSTLSGLVKVLWDALGRSGIELPMPFPSDLLTSSSSVRARHATSQGQIQSNPTSLDDNPPIYITSPVSPLEVGISSSPIHSAFGGTSVGVNSSPPRHNAIGGLISLNSSSPTSSPTGGEFNTSTSTVGPSENGKSTPCPIGRTGLPRPTILERGLSLPHLSIPSQSHNTPHSLALSLSTTGTSTSTASSLSTPNTTAGGDYDQAMSAGPGPPTGDSCDWMRYSSANTTLEDANFEDEGQPDLKRARGLGGGPISSSALSEANGNLNTISLSSANANSASGPGSATPAPSGTTPQGQTQWPTHPLPRRARSGSAPLHHLTTSVGGLSVNQGAGSAGTWGRPRSGSSALLHPGHGHHPYGTNPYPLTHQLQQHLHPHQEHGLGHAGHLQLPLPSDYGHSTPNGLQSRSSLTLGLSGIGVGMGVDMSSGMNMNEMNSTSNIPGENMSIVSSDSGPGGGTDGTGGAGSPNSGSGTPIMVKEESNRSDTGVGLSLS